jgi:hypothetical protein
VISQKENHTIRENLYGSHGERKIYIYISFSPRERNIFVEKMETLQIEIIQTKEKHENVLDAMKKVI